MAHLDVESTLAALSTSEKLSLLAGTDFWHTKALPEHGIPALRTSDGPNGVRGTRFFNGVPASCFPCGTGLGATFNRDLLLQAGELMGVEAKAKGAHVLLGPTINMQRGPLGGRGFESFSEDPVLAGLCAASIVQGVQSQKVAATVKHFVCNDQEHERNKVNSIITERALREIYLLPFQIAIREARPLAVMTAYNKVNGTHASESKKLLQDILRGEWKWEGLVMSDWYGTYSTSESINAGLDLEMPGPTRWRGEAAALAEATDRLEATALDDRTRAVLKLINHCAESGVPENAQEKSNDTPESRKLLRQLAGESTVLLRNDKGVLPLKKDKKTLVIGKHAANTAYCGGGSAALRPTYTVSPLAGIQSKLAEGEVTFCDGPAYHDELPDIAPLMYTSSDASKRGFLMEAYNDSPDVADRQALDSLELDSFDMLLLDYKLPTMNALWYADMEGWIVAEEDGELEIGLSVFGTAKVSVDGQVVLDQTEHQRPGSSFFGLGTAEDRCTVPVKAGRTYHVVVNFASAPTTKLRHTGVNFGGGALKVGGAFKVDTKAQIKKAAELAGQHEQVVLCIGLDKYLESEGFDRPHMKLPPQLDELAHAVLDANPETVVVSQSGTPVEMPWLSKASTLVHAWFAGNETGNGIADVLFGDINPSGKLPLTFPVKDEDTPTFFNYRSEAGRVLYGEDVYIGYRWYDGLRREVNFPFGWGLSYTTFHISDVTAQVQGDRLHASAQIKNTGERQGARVVQLYVSHDSPSIRRPVKELKGFKKIDLEPSQTRKVDFDLFIKEACSFFDERRGQWKCEKGSYKVLVSDSSVTTGSPSASFEVKETFWWSGL
ncbi:hypothetical protein KVT40_001776 [Elsinoe batatas]|uniref:beta-glucosidase n=1 Tax=Elsinoe batatas TaxID=2601811 RepID=A0A8K0L6K9_9PEZI|nr:hypothetical protein KVT40_001776 [Elsinoe batatas]